MPYEEVNGVRLHYEDEGHGSPVLLLHNAFGTGRSVFNGMIEYLAARGHRVLAPDTRGYGGSRPPGRDFPPDYYQRDMEDMAALLAALDLGPVHVAGLSDGAIIGLLLAITHPAQVRSLVTWAANADFPPEERGLYEKSKPGRELGIGRPGDEDRAWAGLNASTPMDRPIGRPDDMDRPGSRRRQQRGHVLHVALVVVGGSRGPAGASHSHTRRGRGQRCPRAAESAIVR